MGIAFIFAKWAVCSFPRFSSPAKWVSTEDQSHAIDSHVPAPTPPAAIDKDATDRAYWECHEMLLPLHSRVLG